MAWLLSSVQRLPGINFETPVGLTDLGFQFDTVFAEEQRDRLQLLMGGYLAGGPHYGIVDFSNPRGVTAGSTRSFVVSAGASTTVNVQPGVAVTKSGNIIVIDSPVVGLVLATPVLTDLPYVVYIEYLTVDDASTNTLTRYQTVEARRRVFAATADVLKVATLADYQNPSIFTSDRLNDIVVLAVVTNSTAAGSLIIDLSNNTSSFNRPWFSPVDVEHRSLIGTGSSLVPHSLGLNDMSQGNLTLYQQMLSHGIVISKDYDVPGCPGKLNLEVITIDRMLTDPNGLVTGTYNSGLVKQRYVNLIGYPIRLLAARSRDDANNDIAVSFIPNTNILLFPTTIGEAGFEQNQEILPAAGFDLYYTSSSAVEPPTAVLSNDQMLFGVPDQARELYVAGGKAYNDLPTTTLNLGNSGPFPKEYNIFLDGTKQFIMAPQVIGCVKYIDQSAPNGIGTGIQTPEFSMFGKARITVGLNNIGVAAPINVSFSVTVQIIGKDINGVSVTENVIFTQADYLPVLVPVADCGFGTLVIDPPQYIFNPPKLFKNTTTVFSSVTSWSVSAFQNMSPQTVVMLWADLKTPVTTELNSLLPVANIRWSGENVCRIRDIRPIAATIQKSEFLDRMLADLNSSVASLAVSQTLAGDATKVVAVAADDFNNPHWLDNLRTQQSRFSDGLRSYFWPGPVGNAADAPELYAEWYYTRAIYLPIVSSQLHVYLQLFSDKFYPTAMNAKNIVQYRLALASSPVTWTAWLNPVTLSSGTMRQISLAAGPWVKMQLRFVTHDVRGFTALMTGA